MTIKIRKAVITAAGWGTRFLPATKSVPKEMLPIVRKPVIQYSVEEAVACGIEIVVIVTSSGKQAIQEHFDRNSELEAFLEGKGNVELLTQVRRISELADICYISQKEQLGLGHAVLTARSVIGNEPFLLFLPDDLFEHQDRVCREMLQISERYGGSVLSVKQVDHKEVDRYGIVKVSVLEDRIYEVTDLVEKPEPCEAPSDLAIMGRYVLMPDVFDALQATAPGRNGEIQLTDALRRSLEYRPIYAYRFEGKHYDAGTPLGWLQTMIELSLKDPELGSQMRDYLSGGHHLR